ncbi:MAG: HAMP domain-containing protein [Candidatus Marinimicrobia bacterium]|nr:HAMP domain-containing protein [Candidatus Neomarinimicrobiota bacterium]MCF7829164.1 HAMP domain-containing protein [Candidatus Neomarinimicrobiota bacterium]MCF7881183.1 HAMP domain-containing protein [Candidatus Neomarinimicrobiota bacterium]
MQIILLVTVLLTASVLVFRSYFLDSFRTYQSQIEYLELESKVNTIYQEYKDNLSQEEAEAFKNEVENLLIDVRQIELAGDFFEREIQVYSIFIFVFLILTVLIIFLISFGLITRPLARLQDATRELAAGNLDIQVKESPFSPINDLIVSFNAMTDELVENRNKLLEAEKEMMWREMAQVMAHEIKNPLTPIRLQTQRLENKYLMGSEDLDKVFSEVMNIVNEEVDNLQSLVNQFRDFARMPSANFEEYSLKDQLREIVMPYENEVEIECDVQEDLPLFYGDKMQMKQVFVNLVQNAIQSMDGQADGYLTIHAEYADPNFLITVEDNGSGITDEDMENIFKPYFTKKKKGTGLGLAIVKRIVQSHEGTIEVDSEPGEGTRFTIEIGLSPESRKKYGNIET